MRPKKKKKLTPEERMFRDNLKRLMEKRGWNIITTAHRTGVHVNQIEAYLDGMNTPSFATLVMLKDGFECQWDDLMSPPVSAAKKKVLKALEDGAKMTIQLIEATGETRGMITKAMAQIREEIVIYGYGTKEEPYSLKDPTPERTVFRQRAEKEMAESSSYTEEELRELWSRLRDNKDGVEMLAQFAMTTKAKAKEMTERWEAERYACMHRRDERGEAQQ